MFGINFPQKGISPYAIFTKFGTVEELTDPHPRAKFNHCQFKMLAYSPQNRRNW